MTKIEFNLNQNIVLMVEREITYVISQTVDKALLLQGFAIVGTAFLI